MQDFEEQERRLMAALGRLGAAMERLGEAPPAAEVEAAGMIDSAAEVEIARLSQLLETARAEKEEQEARAALQRERQAVTLASLQERATGLQSELEGKLGEIERLRQVNLQIREALYALRQALSAGVVDSGAINQSLAAEVEALRASRTSESAEVDALLRAIEPLVAEGTAAAAAAATKEADNA